MPEQVTQAIQKIWLSENTYPKSVALSALRIFPALSSYVLVMFLVSQ